MLSKLLVTAVGLLRKVASWHASRLQKRLAARAVKREAEYTREKEDKALALAAYHHAKAYANAGRKARVARHDAKSSADIKALATLTEL